LVRGRWLFSKKEHRNQTGLDVSTWWVVFILSRAVVEVAGKFLIGPEHQIARDQSDPFSLRFMLPPATYL